MPETTSAPDSIYELIDPAYRRNIKANLDFYLSQGWKVIPIPPGKKRPTLREWPERASSDPKQIAHWWKETPNAGIAVLCGKPSGLCVLDIDNHPPPAASGSKVLRILQALGKIPETPCSKTGGGGFHFLFAHPPGDEVKKCSGVFPGVDFLAGGQCVVLPPTLHPKGEPYQWVKGADVTPLAQPPDWLLALATMKPTPRETLAQILLSTRGIRDGARNVTLTSVAGKLWNLQEIKTASELDTHLQTANRLLCVPEKEPHEVSTIAGSIAKREKHERQTTTSTASTPSTRPRIETPPIRETRTQPAIEAPAKESPEGGELFVNLQAYGLNEIPPYPWLAEGWIAEGDMAVVVGGPTSGKSTLAAWTAQRLARGEPWFGVPMKQAVPVLYVDEEMGETDSTILFLRTGGFHENLALMSQRGVWLAGGDPRGRELLEQAIETHPSGQVPAFVFLDTAQQTFGVSDENSSTQVGAIFRYLFELRSRYGCGFFVLHHTAKDIPKYTRPLIQTGRGSITFGTQATTFWGASIGGGGDMSLRQAKRRGVDRNQMASLRISLETTGPTKPLILTGHGPADEGASKQLALALEVVEFLEGQGKEGKRADIIRGLSIEGRTAQQLLTRTLGNLVEQEVLTQPKRGHYRVAE